MIKTILSSLFAVFLFALGAAGSWYFVQWQEKQKELDQQSESVTSEIAMDDDGHQPMADDESHSAHGAAASAHSEPMEVPVRSGAMTAEQIVRTASLYRQQVEQLKRREVDVESQESHLRLAQQDLDQRKMEIEGILKQVQGYVEQSDRTLSEIAIRRSELQDELAEVKKQREELQKERDAFQNEREGRNQEVQQSNEATDVLDEAQLQNLQKTALLFGSVNQEAAAGIIREFANQGKMNYVAQMLDRMEERDASKIIDALGSDPALVTQLMEELQNMKRETANSSTAKKR